MNNPEEQIQKLNLTLPEPVTPVANYVTSLRVGDLLYLSGHSFAGAPSPVDIGKLGRELTVEQGYEAARRVAVSVLATIRHALGDLNKVKRIVRVLGMVNATEDFKEHPKVINGFSDLMVEVFGERGKHVRSAVGMGSLPGGIAIEVEVTLEVEDGKP